MTDNPWAKCRKKPVEVEVREVRPDERKVETLEGTLHCTARDHFIIRGVNGEIYPIEKSIFWKTYDLVEEASDG